MESVKNSIDLSEFLSVCIQLAEEAEKIMREVYESGDLKTIIKDHDEGPVT